MREPDALTPSSLDLWGDPMPAQARSRCGTLRFWHAPDAGEHLQELMAVAFSPDARRVASAVGMTVRIWDVEDGREVMALHGHTQRVKAALYVSPTRIATSGYDNTVRLWDVERGVEVRRWQFGLDGISPLALSPDGRTLLAGSWCPDGFAVIDLETGELLRHVHPEESVGGPSTLSFSPDGSQVLVMEQTCEDVRLCVFDTATWALRWATPPRYLGYGAWAAFSPDGQRVRCPCFVKDQRPVVHEYDARTGELLAIPSLDRGRPVTLADGSVARIINGRLVLFRDGALERWARIPYTYVASGWEPVVAPGGRWASFGRGAPASLLLLDLQARKAHPERAHRGLVTMLTFSRDGEHLLTYGSDGTLRTWACASGEQLECRTLEEWDDRFIHLHGGRVLQLRRWRDTFIRDVLGGTDVRVEGSVSMYDAVWSDDRALLADLVDEHVEGERTVHVHETRTGKLLRRVPVAVDGRVALALSRTGRFLLTSERAGEPAPERVKGMLWDLERGTPLRGVPLWPRGSTWHLYSPRVWFSPDERWLFFRDEERAVVLVDVECPERRVRLDSEAPVSAIAFSEDGTRIATGEWTGGIRVWTPEGQRVGSLEGHGVGVYALAFSPDGGFLASGSVDSTALIWPREAWECGGR